MAKGIATHATIDNNDATEDTVTGAGTTHDTNWTLFQPLLPGNILILLAYTFMILLMHNLFSAYIGCNRAQIYGF